MIGELSTWYEGRSLREKRLLLVMAALAVLTIIWAGIIRPVNDGLSSARSRHASAVIALAETDMRLAALKTLQQNRPAPLDGPLDVVMRARAAEAGFALGNVTAEGSDRVQLSIPSAKPGALFAWIALLEDNGILIDQLTTANNGDRTVSAQITLKARGA